MMFDYFVNRVSEQKPKTFDDFHAIVCKIMPDVTSHPEMYNRCYDLMKLSWDTSAKNRIEK